MIVLITDFGIGDPYLGQMQAVIQQAAPQVPCITLFPELPAYAVQAGAYLLAAYTHEFPAGTVFLCVVDPGVGTERTPVVIKLDDRWFIGPDNGLFDVLKVRVDHFRQWRITYQPDDCSNTFHGRDIFAPVAASLAKGDSFPGELMTTEEISPRQWPDDLLQIVYVDHYGNAITGLRGIRVSTADQFEISGRELSYARTFSEVDRGRAFWHINANGLVEFSMNQANLAQELKLVVGDAFTWIQS
jgi:S-adenosylmethionine hydrolase